MKHKKELVIGLSVILVIVEVTSVSVSLIEQKYERYFQMCVLKHLTLFFRSRNSSEHAVQDYSVTEVETLWMLGANQILGMLLCIICNVLVILAIRLKRPNFMLPWLIIYFVGKTC